MPKRHSDSALYASKSALCAKVTYLESGKMSPVPQVSPERTFSGLHLLSPWLWGGIALFFLLACALLVLRAEGMKPAAGSVLQRSEATGETKSVSSQGSQHRVAGAANAGQFQRIEEKNGQITVEYGCRNFNNDPLSVVCTISAQELANYKQGYGFSQSELDALNLWQKKELDDAYHYAVQHRLKQEELNRMGVAIRADYHARHSSLLVSRGFAVQPGNVLVADIPGIARRNVKELRPFARALESSAGKRGYDSSEIIGAALSLVQTAFLYENVPMLVNGRQTGGIYPPLETVAKGRGDCDTKSALLASILLNWGKVKLVGVGVPDHYLMAVLANPAKGDAFVEYQGLRYVLMEPAGPAWLPPGVVGPVTSAVLAAGTPIALEPFTTN
jgi:hypothetical protein